MSWNSTSIMYAQYQVHLKITHSPRFQFKAFLSNRDLHLLGLECTWNRKDIKNRGENSQICCIGGNIWNITIFKGSHRGAPLPVLTWTWCTWTTTGSGSAGTSPRYTSQVLDTCRVIIVQVLNFRGASMCVDLPCICKLNWHFWKIIFHLIWDKTLKIVIQKVKKVPKIPCSDQCWGRVSLCWGSCSCWGSIFSQISLRAIPTRFSSFASYSRRLTISQWTRRLTSANGREGWRSANGREARKDAAYAPGARFSEHMGVRRELFQMNFLPVS